MKKCSSIGLSGLIAVGGMTLFLAGCGGSSGGVSLTPPPATTPAIYEEGELLVKFTGGPASDAARNAHKKIGATVLHTFDYIEWELVKLPRGLSVPKAVTLYLRQPGCLDAEPNYIGHAD